MINGLWFACSQPERPPDPYVVWHYACDVPGGCSGCGVKAEALARRYPDDPRVAWVLSLVSPTT